MFEYYTKDNVKNVFSKRLSDIFFLPPQTQSIFRVVYDASLLPNTKFYSEERSGTNSLKVTASSLSAGVCV